MNQTKNFQKGKILQNRVRIASRDLESSPSLLSKYQIQRSSGIRRDGKRAQVWELDPRERRAQERPARRARGARRTGGALLNSLGRR